MPKKPIPGLILRGNVWHIQKVIKGVGRLRESTGEREIEKAEAYLARRLVEIERQVIHGVRPVRTFRAAATKYLNESEKKSLSRDAASLALLDSYIGKLPIDQVHMGTLEPFIKDRKASNISAGTINRDLAVVRNILNLAAGLWHDELTGKTWLETAPKILTVTGPKRKPYPLSWEEQGRLFKLLPEYLANMALFAVNTGCREQEICQLRWDWEEKLPALGTSVFILPEWVVKGQEGKTVERLVPLNKVARSVIEAQRGIDETYVFTYKGSRLDRMNNRAWRQAWREAGLPTGKGLSGNYLRRVGIMGRGRESKEDSGIILEKGHAVS